MSPALLYLPAYLGLFAAEVLAITCNAFLDIQYGGFTVEVIIWSCAMAYTLRAGWRQQGVISEDGNKTMRRFLIFGGLLSVLIFIPAWGFPRAGLYILAMLMVAYNCITTTRRHLHINLLISLVMVMFAASHYRADWTMLFYLVPYVAAVVFTLVAEQVNRKADDLRQQSLGNQVIGAQGAAISAATLVILALGLTLYTLTPQTTWAGLSWRLGNPTNLGYVGNQAIPGQGGIAPSGQMNGAGNGKAVTGNGQGSGNGWPSPDEMRAVAKRQGMPQWQVNVINALADVSESTQKTFAPIKKTMSDWWEAFKQWLSEHRQAIINSLIILAFIALLYALWRLMREAKSGTWLLTRLDYLRYGVFAMHAPDNRGAAQYYMAMERLFTLYDFERPASANTREYLSQIGGVRSDMRGELLEMTRLFEDYRYGTVNSANQKITRMRELYRHIYRRIDI
jgi:hypothetical protein